MSSKQHGTWLESHPKLINALFVALVLLTQAGVVVAESASDINGP